MLITLLSLDVITESLSNIAAIRDIFNKNITS